MEIDCKNITDLGAALTLLVNCQFCVSALGSFNDGFGEFSTSTFKDKLIWCLGIFAIYSIFAGILAFILLNKDQLC